MSRAVAAAHWPRVAPSTYHGALAGVVVLAAVFDLVVLDREGYANSYYAAAVLSMTRSWLQVASVKLLGFSDVAMLLPQALAGVASVAVVTHLVARSFESRRPPCRAGADPDPDRRGGPPQQTMGSTLVLATGEGRRPATSPASDWVASTPMVPICAQIPSARMAASTSCLTITSRTAAPVASIVITTSASRTASTGSACAVALRSASRAAGPGVRFQTWTSKPRSSSRSAIAAPISPAPSNAT